MSAQKTLRQGLRFAGVVLVLSLLLAVPAQGAADEPPFQFKITLSEAAATGIADLGLEVPVTGRLYVIVTRDDSPEPRRQIDVTGVPFWGMNVRGFAGGDTLLMGVGQQEIIGYPLADFSQIPDGDYYVQAFLNVYTTFHRADGYVLELHHDTGSGQQIWRAPGNAYSVPIQVHLGGGAPRMINLELSEVIPPIDPIPPGGVLEQGNPQDTTWVKYIKIRSEALSQFWGRDMYIGANILLPAGYDSHPDVRYPVLYNQGHFPGSSPPFGFRESPCNTFCQWWTDTSTVKPRFIAVSIRHASPYYDASYAVNSPNVGPYGDAIVNELIPYIDAHFRTIPDAWARVPNGGSTGGWEAAALKVWNPDFFGHTWVWCPDPVDFRYHQIVNIYSDPNAYWNEYDWTKLERPSARGVDGSIDFTVGMENHWELAMGTKTRSYAQWAVWEAVFGPVGPDGYPARIWDPVTGVIDHDVAQRWKDNTDINQKLQLEWSTLGPKVQGQMHFAVGEADTYFLNEAVHLLETDVKELTNPTADFTFEYGCRRPHCWRGSSPTNPGQQITYQEWIVVVSDTITPSAPPGADTSSWKY